MIVTDIRCVLLSDVSDPDEPMVWVGGQIDSWDAALVEVTVEDGTTGLGEVAQAIMAASAVPGIVEALKPFVIGLDIDDPSMVGDQLRAKTYFWARGGISSGVIGAIEVAAWDLAGKRAGKPTFELMNAAAKGDIEIYASGGLGTTFDQVAAWVDEMQDLGYRTVKFRAMRDPDTTIELVDHLLARLRPQTWGILDAVQGCAGQPWRLSDAIRVGRHLENKQVRWFEEPRRVDDVAGYAAVRHAVTVPISGAESLALADDLIRLVDGGGLDVAQPDVSMIGGPAEFERVAKAAHQAGVATVPHVWGSAVTVMANLHTSLALPQVELFEMCTLTNPLRDHLLVEPLVIKDSRLSAPTAPGLGVALTPELEARFEFKPGGGHVIR